MGVDCQNSGDDFITEVIWSTYFTLKKREITQFLRKKTLPAHEELIPANVGDSTT